MKLSAGTDICIVPKETTMLIEGVMVPHAIWVAVVFDGWEEVERFRIPEAWNGIQVPRIVEEIELPIPADASYEVAEQCILATARGQGLRPKPLRYQARMRGDLITLEAEPEHKKHNNLEEAVRC